MARCLYSLPLLFLQLFFVPSLELDDTDTSETAMIVASKFTLSQYAVEGMDYVIDYRLYNVGEKVNILHDSFFLLPELIHLFGIHSMLNRCTSYFQKRHRTCKKQYALDGIFSLRL